MDDEIEQLKQLIYDLHNHVAIGLMCASIWRAINESETLHYLGELYLATLVAHRNQAILSVITLTNRSSEAHSIYYLFAKTDEMILNGSLALTNYDETLLNLSRQQTRIDELESEIVDVRNIWNAKLNNAVVPYPNKPAKPVDGFRLEVLAADILLHVFNDVVGAYAELFDDLGWDLIPLVDAAELQALYQIELPQANEILADMALHDELTKVLNYRG